MVLERAKKQRNDLKSNKESWNVMKEYQKLSVEEKRKIEKYYVIVMLLLTSIQYKETTKK